MTEYNEDIKKEMRKRRIKQYELANLCGVHRCTFNLWLNTGELSEEKKKMILSALKNFNP